MKTFLLILATLFTIRSPAALRGAPYMPESDKRFSDAEIAATALAARTTILEALPASVSQGTNGIMNVRSARFTVDCTTSGDCSVGAHSLGVALPANALIVSSYFYTKTKPVTTGGATMAISCEDANNIFSALDVSSKQSGEKFIGAAAITSGSTIVSSIAAACNITATFATQPYTAGVINGWLSYQVTD